MRQHDHGPATAVAAGNERTRWARRTAWSVALVMVAAVLAMPARAVATAANAQPDDGILIGSWTGFSQVQGSGSSPSSPAHLAIDTQDGRRFAGRGQIGDLQCSLQGTIANSGQTNAMGECDGTSKLVLQGEAQPGWDTGTDYVVWRDTLRSTSTNENGNGAVVLLRDLGGPRHVADGRWEGGAVDGREERVATLVVELEASTGKGVLHYQPLHGSADSTYDTIFDLSLAADSGRRHGVFFVGGGHDGLVTFVGQLVPATQQSPATLEGTLTVLSAAPQGGVGRGRVILESDLGQVPSAVA